ncbi:MAG: C25 family cysteine peptidase, partial [candidate division WOR-3 bacterium]
TTEPGKPLLPIFSGNLLIPAGANLKGITITRIEKVELEGSYHIYPTQPMRPLSRFNSVPFVEPDPVVYSSNTVYPSEPLTPVPAGSKAGFRLAGFLLCPFEYRPQTGKLTLWTRVELEASYEENRHPVTALTPGQREFVEADIKELVLNQADVSRMAPPTFELDGPELDVVIVTSSALAPALVNFRSYLARKGYFTEIMPTETIYARYPGRDNAEKIRNMLKDKFATQGLKFAILAGDVQHVPCRTGYLPYSPYNVPADLYFSDLDGTWDANNNSQFGEYSYTNFNPDSVDLYSDIYIGRLPLDDAANCVNFLAKDTTYECHPDTAYLDNV